MATKHCGSTGSRTDKVGSAESRADVLANTGAKLGARDARCDGRPSKPVRCVERAQGHVGKSEQHGYHCRHSRIHQYMSKYHENAKTYLWKQGDATRSSPETIQARMASQTMQIWLEIHRNASVYAQQTQNRRSYLLGPKVAHRRVRQARALQRHKGNTYTQE